MTREEFLKSLSAALCEEDSASVRGLLLDALAKGKEHGTLLGWLDDGREMFPSEEDTILDAMDQLEQWGGEYGRIGFD